MMEPVHATPHRAFVFIRRILFDAHGVSELVHIMRRRAFVLIGRSSHGASELVHIMRRRAFVLIGRSSRTELADGARTAYRSLCTSCAAARLCLSDGARTACWSLCTSCAAARLCLSDGARGRSSHGVSELVHIMRRRAFVLIGRSSHGVSELVHTKACHAQWFFLLRTSSFFVFCEKWTLFEDSL
ncbi:hypothetical protein HanIR_Chr00c11g0907901 [Helianthus annuus]|nr:hypothetical protein HanIR_Chr09g0417301 [Helianthus annuus]KAJ0629427.1 hypothetical protein HanIR_Chr00c11g0907901 [Helianthus annuus]